ncbi:N-acetylglutamate synthase-like GNAT family acetyltransferase [Chitinophaga niastensis]|uniref:N-acetylglutamate synthase-like GNAT family acetyltransferase n=1 Tax=Chitinophaga niastensis TaxID=536980 RepID=A0A2P8HK43_CHINA|nr:GNAT family N-acetyltransferase [Chitinophaga niastensis]PSL46596.1 N-acetylglutamate synthase-like GNAT family acetyltransferase [Chitinophaga niastensis]
METIEVKEGDYIISTDKSKLDEKAIHDFLANESYWAQNIPLSVVKKSLEGSLCFGVFHEDKQIGFARVITDGVAFAYLADVYMLVPYRGKGLSKFLMRTIMAHPHLQGLRRFMLVTADAHELYRQFGFTSVPNPEKIMQIHNPQAYTK